MTNAATSAEPKARWGWRMLALLGILMTLDGAWLFWAGGGAAVFESDTGVSMAEVAASYPSVVEVMNRRGRLLGLLVAGLGVIVVVASAGRRTTDARNAVAVTGATTLVVSAFVLAAGNVEVGAVYGAFGLLAGAGLWLMRAGRTP